MKHKILTGEKVFLEPFAEKHLSEQYVQWLNDPVVCQFNRHGDGSYTREKALSYLESVKSSKDAVVFAIYTNHTAKHIGNISINNISWENRSAEISILIGDKSVWGQGIGTEACKLALDYGFTELKLHRLTLGMTTSNLGMIQIAQRLGFKEEGVFKDALCKKGQYFDITQWFKINPQG